MRAAQLIAVLGVPLLFASQSYAQHGGGHVGGGFSGHGTFSFGHSSGRGLSSHSSSRFVSGIRHIVPGFWRSPKPTAPSTDSLAAVRVGTGDPPRRPIIGTRPSAPLFLRRPPLRNPCFGHAFCAGFGFGSPVFCDPLFGFGRCFPFFGLTFGFQGNFLATEGVLTRIFLKNQLTPEFAGRNSSEVHQGLAWQGYVTKCGTNSFSRKRLRTS